MLKQPVGALPDRRAILRIFGGCLVFLFCLVSSGYGRLIPLTIFHTADLHACFVPQDAPHEKGAVGWLACGSVILEERNSCDHSLLIHTGDLLSGAFPGVQSSENRIIKMLNYMGYDAWIPGIHDFSVGADQFIEQCKQSPCSVLAANLSRKNDFSLFSGGQIIRRDGVCIALVGLTSPIVSSFYLRERLNGLWFHDSVRTLFPVMRALRQEKPDIWVLAAHQGFFYNDNNSSQLHAVLKAYPEFDLVLGGETHACIQSKRIGNTWLTQAGSYGRYAGKVDLVYDNVQRALVTVQPTCIVVRADRPIHPDLEKMFGSGASSHDELLMNLDERLPVSAQTNRPSFVRLMGRAVLKRTNADAFLFSLPATLRAVEPGRFTSRNLFGLLPAEDRLVTCSMTAEDIEHLMQYIELQKSDEERFFLWGINRTGTGDKRTLCDSAGRALHPRKRYLLAVGSGLAASSGGRYQNIREMLMKPACVMNVHPVLIRDAVSAYIRGGGTP